MLSRAVSTIGAIPANPTSSPGPAGAARTAGTEPVRTPATGTAIATRATVLPGLARRASQHTSQTRSAGRAIATSTTRTGSTPQCPQRRITAGATGATSATID